MHENRPERLRGVDDATARDQIEAHSNAIGYVRDMLGQILEMSASADCAFLAYLIEMALTEANDMVLQGRSRDSKDSARRRDVA